MYSAISYSLKLSPTKFHIHKQMLGMAESLSMKICPQNFVFDQNLAKTQNIYPLKILGYTVYSFKARHL